MASTTHRVPVERITAEARAVHPAHALLTLVAAVLYGIGWLAGKILGALWLAVVWSFTAVKVGWVEATRGRDR